MRVGAEGTVRVLPRVKPGAAAIHLLNYDYDAGRDAVAVARNVKVQLDLPVLGVGKAVSARFLAPEAEPVSHPV